MGDRETVDMAVRRVDDIPGYVTRMKRSEVPQGAYLMDRVGILAHHYKEIENWQPQSDVFWLKYGRMMNIIVANFTGLSMIVHFRRKFNLRAQGIVQSVFATLMVPAAMTGMIYKRHEENLLLTPSCPTCLEVRSGVSLVLTSFLYSLAIAPLTCIYLSRQHNTYLDPKHSFRPNLIYAFKMKSRTFNFALLLIVANFASGYFTLHKQGQEVDKVIVKQAVARGKSFVENLEKKG